MKVFLCFAFEKGELQRGHLSPDKESRELFAKCKGEALIIRVTDTRRCRVSSRPPLRPVPAAPRQLPASTRAPVSLLPCRPRLLPRLPSIRGSGCPNSCPAPGDGTRAMDVPSMGAPTRLPQREGQRGGVPRYVPGADALLKNWELWAGRSVAGKAHPGPRPFPGAPGG